MKFSVCLSTGFEGVMYPIPFASAEQFVEQSLLCERLGYDSVWGNDHVTTQHYVKELFPDRPPNFYEPLITLAAIAGRPGPSSSARLCWCCRCASLSTSPSRS